MFEKIKIGEMVYMRYQHEGKNDYTFIPLPSFSFAVCDLGVVIWESGANEDDCIPIQLTLNELVEMLESPAETLKDST